MPDRADRADRLRQVDGGAVARRATAAWSSSTPIRSRGRSSSPASRRSRRSSRGSGRSFVGADGTLDRAALGRIVFADPAALRDLEAIIHPAVRPRILAAIAAAEAEGAEVVVIEAIRLVEGGLAELCDEVWLVTCDPAVQRARLIGRGATPEDADARIDAQTTLVDRAARSPRSSSTRRAANADSRHDR